VSVKKARQRAPAGSNALPSELCSSFFQSQIWLMGNDRQHPVRLVFEWRNAATARLRLGAPTFIPALHPLDDRTHGNSKMLGGFMPRSACFNHIDNALTQVTGVRLWHRYPPRSRINAETITHSGPFGNPPIQIGREPL
jgi:hypothetical protein